MKQMNSPFRQFRRRERGYVLIILLLAVALSAIFALTWVQKVEFQIQRDREEELIHRGVQYSRAVRRYFKKFGRYPTKVEDLESTNNLRFLRKRYKDPITGKDFKPLRLTDVHMAFNSPAVKGLTPVSQMNAGGPGALNGTLGGRSLASSVAATGPGSDANANSDAADAASAAQVPSDASQRDRAVAGSAGATDSAPSSAPPAGLAAGPQVFGGGAIVGVASISKLKTIREFNKKDHYNQWQFIYDPSTDRGGLLMTPNQPPLQGAVQNPQQQQQNGQQGTFGQGPSFGQGMNPTNPAPQQPQQNPEQPEQQ
jgi:hypothetical protein